MLEAADSDRLANHDWDELLEICGSLADYESRYNGVSSDTVIHYLLADPGHVNSIHNCVFIARDNARVCREVISQDLWEVINDFYWYIKQYPAVIPHWRELNSHLYQVIQYSYIVQGVVKSLLHDVPYSFIQIGKWLERAEKTARILNVLCEKTAKEMKSMPQNNYYHWLSALNYVGAYDSFLKKHPPFILTKDVLAFLISDSSFPRSIAYCFNSLHREVEILEGGRVSHSEALFAQLHGIKAEMNSVEQEDWEERDQLAFLDDFQNRCHRLGSLFSRTYYLVHP